jgi:hypothetical protein
MEENIKQKARKAIGDQLKKMRREPRNGFKKKISAVDVAAAVFSEESSMQSRISNYEQGYRLPALHHFQAICEYLGYTLEEALPKDADLMEALEQDWAIKHLETFVSNLDDFAKSVNKSTNQSDTKMVASPSSVRRVVVNYMCALEAGKFIQSNNIKSLNKFVAVPSALYSPSSFVVVHVGVGLGDVLEHEQPLVVDRVEVQPGDLCLLAKGMDTETPEFVLCVYEGSSAFGRIFRQKGTLQKRSVLDDDEVTVLKVTFIRNPSDISSQ